MERNQLHTGDIVALFTSAILPKDPYNDFDVKHVEAARVLDPHPDGEGVLICTLKDSVPLTVQSRFVICPWDDYLEVRAARQRNSLSGEERRVERMQHEARVLAAAMREHPSAKLVGANIVIPVDEWPL